jgi:hypothetical protein
VVEVSEKKCFRVIPSKGYEKRCGILSTREAKLPPDDLLDDALPKWTEELSRFCQAQGLPHIEEVVLQTRYAGRSYASLLAVMSESAGVKFQNVQMGASFVDLTPARNRRKAKKLGRGVNAPKLPVVSKVNDQVSSTMENFMGWKLSYVDSPTYLCGEGAIVHKESSVRISGVPYSVNRAQLQAFLASVGNLPQPLQVVPDRNAFLPGQENAAQKWIVSWPLNEATKDASSPAFQLNDFYRNQKRDCRLLGQQVSLRRLDIPHAGGRFTQI